MHGAPTTGTGGGKEETVVVVEVHGLATVSRPPRLTRPSRVRFATTHAYAFGSFCSWSSTPTTPS